MIARGSLWLPLAMLLLLAGLSYWIERSVKVGAAAATETAEPEGIMENFEALRTDAAGRPHYRLTARKLKHYSGSKRTELESPRFVFLDPEHGETHAVATEATVSPDGDEVDLRGDVEVERIAHAGEPAMSLTTARLIVYPDTERMRAPGAVRIEDGSLTLRAGAMDYDAKRRIIKLTGRVQARYLTGKG